MTFAGNIGVGLYTARQSIPSAAARRVSDQVLQQIAIKDGTHDFHVRSILADMEKTSFADLSTRDAPIIVDLIDERVGLAKTTCGTMVTYSQPATQFSNASSYWKAKVPAFGEDYMLAFEQAIPSFAACLGSRQVIIHEALYAQGPWPYAEENTALAAMYDMLATALPHATRVSADPKLQFASSAHKWGQAPYHYIDQYYIDVVKQIGVAVGLPAVIRSDVSLQALSQSVM